MALISVTAVLISFIATLIRPGRRRACSRPRRCAMDRLEIREACAELRVSQPDPGPERYRSGPGGEKNHHRPGGSVGSRKNCPACLLGALDRPSDGTVLFRGEDIFRKSDRDLATFRNGCIGFVFQFHHLLPEFSAQENVMMPALIARVPRKKASAMAEELLADGSGAPAQPPPQWAGWRANSSGLPLPAPWSCRLSYCWRMSPPETWT